MDDLIEKLQGGCIYRPKRWSGDTHDDLGGSIDEAATDSLLAEAAAALEAVREDAERYRWLREKGHPDSNSGIAVSVDSWNDWGRPQATYLSGAELDAAIDAAREARDG